MKVGLIQQKNTDRAANIEKLKVNIRKAAREGAELVVLQELHNGLYFCQTEDTSMFDLAETIPGPSTEIFGALAKELGIVLVLSALGRSVPRACTITRPSSWRKTVRSPENTARCISPDDPAYYEKFYFTPGDLGFEPIDTSVGRLGVLVCWDQWYPEAARLMAMRGAEMLIYPTAIGWESSDTQEEKDRQLGAWVTIQRGHAVANGLPVISVNRTGHEPDPSGQTGGIRFWGNSFVAGPQGELLTVFPNDEEEVRVIEIDKTRGENVRRWWPFFRDRRIDAFGGLTERFLV